MNENDDNVYDMSQQMNIVIVISFELKNSQNCQVCHVAEKILGNTVNFITIQITEMRIKEIVIYS